MGKMAASQSRGLQGPRSCGVPRLRGGAVPAPRSPVLASSLPAPGELQPEQTTASNLCTAPVSLGPGAGSLRARPFIPVSRWVH